MILALSFLFLFVGSLGGERGELIKLPKDITYSTYSSRGRAQFNAEQCNQIAKDLGLNPGEIQKLADALSKKWRVTVRTHQNRIFVVTNVGSEKQSFSFSSGVEFTKEANSNFILGRKTKSLYTVVEGNKIVGKDSYENGAVVEIEAFIDRFELLLTLKTKSMTTNIVVQRD